MRLLDTNICIAYLNGSDEKIRIRLLEEEPGSYAVCSIVKVELNFGARKSRNVDSNLQKVQAFLLHFESYPFDDAAADQYGLIRSLLERGGNLIGANDLMIASIALSKDVTLVSRDQREFLRVPGLRVETW